MMDEKRISRSSKKKPKTTPNKRVEPGVKLNFKRRVRLKTVKKRRPILLKREEEGMIIRVLMAWAYPGHKER